MKSPWRRQIQITGSRKQPITVAGGIGLKLQIPNYR